MKLKSDLEPYVSKEQEIIDMFRAVFAFTVEQFDSYEDMPEDLQMACPKNLLDEITE